ncbi:armadillo-type protein [Nemania abortiva]|nr:armadillo-type protein [Nemania abortiva]
MSGSVNQLLDNIPDDEVQQTKALRRVADVAWNLWKTDPGSPDLDLLAQRIGDSARVESNRTALGESGLLEFFCSVVSTQGLRSTLAVQCLRVIGNSSADQDENRARVVASGCLPSIIALLNGDDAILRFVIPVLFNISVDYEPAHKAIYQAGINPELISLISGSRLEDSPATVNYACKLLGLIAAQEPEANLVDPATPFVLLTLANNEPSPLDAGDFFAQVSVALTYLAQEQFQQTFLERPGSIHLILQTFSTACSTSLQEGLGDDAQLKQVLTAFTATLADLSAQPLFASLCSLDGPEVETLQRWISAQQIPLQSAACLALGNIARSDDKCSYLVQNLAIHKPLIAILADRANVDAGLLHSVLSFLRNLAILAENKPILGDAGLFEADVLPRIWDLDPQTQVQFDAVSLTRSLLVGCPANVRRICAPLGEDSTSAAQSRSKLHLLMSLNARSDQEPTQMETARAITTVCRVLHSNPDNLQSEILVPHSISTHNTPTPSNPTTALSSPSSPLPPLETFYADHSTITDAMLHLSLQSKFPVLKSELLFVFALMARTSAGASVVARCTHRPELVDMLVEIVTGEKPVIPSGDGNSDETEPNTAAAAAVTFPPSEISIVAGLEAQAPPAAAAPGVQKTMRDVDRENALVLVAQLLQQCPNELPTGPRQTFQNLLREGGQRVLRERGVVAAACA